MKGSFDVEKHYEFTVNYRVLLTNIVIIWILKELNAPRWCNVIVALIVIENAAALFGGFAVLIYHAVKRLYTWRLRKRAKRDETTKIHTYLHEHGFKYVKHLPDGDSGFYRDAWVNEETGQVVDPIRLTYKGVEEMPYAEIVKLVEEYNYDHVIG